MVDDAHTHFVDGLRVSPEHLQHLQDRLREGVLDVRRALGLGRIAWGLRVTLKLASPASVEIAPGVAFGRDGVRLSVDALQVMPIPAGGDGTLAVVLRAVQGDREPFRFKGEKTVLTLRTDVELGAAPPANDLDTLVIATVTRAGGALSLAQDDALFIAAGAHTHSGQHTKDADDRWHYDGAAVSGAGNGKGDKGDKGDQGATGATGPAGAKGEKGEKGDSGAAGATGPTGATGAKGEKGDKGDSGATGATGPAGATGAKGEKGDRGDSGATGATGPTGAPGAKGEKGDKGDSGATGATGPAGATGAKGEKGDRGDSGATGPTGATGPKGATGDKGATGEKGAPGDRGATGATGATGPTGPKGDKGDKGAKGDKGDQGPKGDPGPQGLQGPQGLSGDPLDQDWAMITQINWPHGGTLSFGSTPSLLMSGLQITLSRSLHPTFVTAVPAVVEVWVQPTDAVAGEVPLIIPLPGALKVTQTTVDQTLPSERAISTITWTVIGEIGHVGQMLRLGRVLVRVHCGALVDDRLRQFSATLLGILPAVRLPGRPRAPIGLVLPGGVLESWFFIGTEFANR